MLIRMQRRGLMGLLYLLMAAVLVLPQAGLVSAWSGDSTVNTAICTAANLQEQPRIISDGAGGALITWQDARSGETDPVYHVLLYDIYAQRVDSNGAALWAADGVPICTSLQSQTNPQLVSDGAGGAIITWADQRSGPADIYAQRVDSNGAALWAADGVPICTASQLQTAPQLISDGVGGAIITWYDERSGPADIYAQRVNSSGGTTWTADGVLICQASNQQYMPQLVSDGSGGAIITWYDQRIGYADIYAQRVDSSGAVQWTPADGVAICTFSNEQSNPHIVSDGSGGAIITWFDNRNGDGQGDIYAQKVNSGGVVQWTADGEGICTKLGYQNGPQLVSDGSGGAIITWWDYSSGNSDLYVQKVNSGGSVQWTPADGVAICTASGQQYYPNIVTDGAGGAIITWPDYRSSGTNPDIYARKVNSGGAVQWAANGSAICTASGQQYYPELVSDGAGGAIITWSDYRSGPADIYAQKVDSSGNLLTAPAPIYNGGGGGGDWGGPLSTSLWVIGNGRYWEVTREGIFLRDAVITSEDGSVTIFIPSQTKGLGPDGKSIFKITADPIDPPPAPEGMHILAAFDFEPDGATFSPGIQITIAFDPAEVGEGETVAIAFYNEATGVWDFVEGTVNPDGTASFNVDHFTVFAVLTDTADQSATDVTATPTAASAASSIHESGGISTAAWIGIAVGIILAIGILCLLLLRWRRSLSY